MLKDLFTDKNFPVSISEKIIKAGIETDVFYYIKYIRQYDYDYVPKLIIKTKCGFHYNISDNVHYPNLKIEKNDIIIPAWTADQLWKYIESLYYKRAKVNEERVTLYIKPKAIAANIKVECWIGQNEYIVHGKITDPSVPARILTELEKRGLLK